MTQQEKLCKQTIKAFPQKKLDAYLLTLSPGLASQISPYRARSEFKKDGKKLCKQCKLDKKLGMVALDVCYLNNEPK